MTEYSCWRYAIDWTGTRFGARPRPSGVAYLALSRLVRRRWRPALPMSSLSPSVSLIGSAREGPAGSGPASTRPSLLPGAAAD